MEGHFSKGVYLFKCRVFCHNHSISLELLGSNWNLRSRVFEVASHGNSVFRDGEERVGPYRLSPNYCHLQLLRTRDRQI